MYNVYYNNQVLHNVSYEILNVHVCVMGFDYNYCNVSVIRSNVIIWWSSKGNLDIIFECIKILKSPRFYYINCKYTLDYIYTITTTIKPLCFSSHPVV